MGIYRSAIPIAARFAGRVAFGAAVLSTSAGCISSSRTLPISEDTVEDDLPGLPVQTHAEGLNGVQVVSLNNNKYAFRTDGKTNPGIVLHTTIPETVKLEDIGLRVKINLACIDHNSSHLPIMKVSPQGKGIHYCSSRSYSLERSESWNSVLGLGKQETLEVSRVQFELWSFFKEDENEKFNTWAFRIEYPMSNRDCEVHSSIKVFKIKRHPLDPLPGCGESHEGEDVLKFSPPVGSE